MEKLNIFCGRCNGIVPFSITVDGNGEWIADCDTCDHVLKWPSDVKLAAAIAEHNEANTPSVQVADDGSVILSKDQEKQLAAAVKAHA